MRRLFTHPLFVLGVLIRIAFVWIFESSPAREWYVPFLDVSTAYWSLDPWSSWIALGGDPQAFPYGIGMWIVLLPATMICKLFVIPIWFGYYFTLFFVDVLQLIVLSKLYSAKPQLLLVLYWLSPVSMIVTYVFGFNDVIAALFLSLMLWGFRNYRMVIAGTMLAIAISVKISIIVVLPIVIMYILNNKSINQSLRTFSVYFCVTLGLIFVPYFLSEHALIMLLSTEEISKVYDLYFIMGDFVVIYALPMVYLIFSYLIWQIRRLNFELFYTAIGIVLLLIVLMTPAAPGWFVWSLPLLVMHQANQGVRSLFLIGLYTVLYASNLFMHVPFELRSDNISIMVIELLPFSDATKEQFYALLYTAIASVGTVVIMHVWRTAIRRNDFFRLSRQPFVIGIAGDSGAGKDTYADALEGLIGNQSVVRVSGDDYHLWDRHKPLWKVLTHLNPIANDLEGFTNDVIALADGKSILSRHYNHETGKMSRLHRVSSNDFIIVSGLHAMYVPMLRECYDLSVYLDIDESLRRYFKLRRDVRQRGHKLEQVIQSMVRRQPDAQKYIRPQIEHANLIFSLQLAREYDLNNLEANHQFHYKLRVCMRSGVNQLALRRVLVGVCGLYVDTSVNTENAEVVMFVEGENSAEDMALAANILCPNVLEFIQIMPKWQDGMMGIMQLITLLHVYQALTKRLI